VHEIEIAVLAHRLLGVLPALLEGRNGRADDRRAGFGQLGSDEGDTLDVLVPVRAGEAQLGAEFAAHGVPQQEGHGPAALLVERHVQGAGHGIFTTVLVAGQEDGKTLFEPGWVAFSKDFDDFRVRKPFGDVASGAEARAEFCARDV